MSKTYAELGSYSGLVAAANKSHRLYPFLKPGKKAQALAKEWLAFAPGKPKAKDVRVERTWEHDGVAGEFLTWSVGYGPRTEAYYLRPAGVKGPLPGVLALHDHGGFKYYGKEKVALGPDAQPELLKTWHQKAYGGRAFANELAKRGFAVLVHDCFCWGSRKFPLSDIPEWNRNAGRLLQAGQPIEFWPGVGASEEISLYTWTSIIHELNLQKFCHVVGTTMMGVVGWEDRVAADYLNSRKDVQKGGLGCVGLSGGGCRSGVMAATCEHIRAAVVVGMMSTYEGYQDRNVTCHTWMCFPTPALARQGDWPDMVACRAPSPLMVQYDKEDALFTPEGMKAADTRLKKLFRAVGKPKNYVGQFYPGPHKFDVPMQDAAFTWMAEQLQR